jgi:hypothetical protein
MDRSTVGALVGAGLAGATLGYLAGKGKFPIHDHDLLQVYFVLLEPGDRLPGDRNERER